MCDRAFGCHACTYFAISFAGSQYAGWARGLRHASALHDDRAKLEIHSWTLDIDAQELAHLLEGKTEIRNGIVEEAVDLAVGADQFECLDIVGPALYDMLDRIGTLADAQCQ